MINREDMLELTRRMTPARTSFVRMAGCYTDSDGEYDGSFNIHFLKLSGSEKARNLAIAKKIPFAESNEKLREYRFPETSQGPGSIWQMLMALRECGLKNDALSARWLENTSREILSVDFCSLPLWTGAEIWNGLIFMQSVQRGAIRWPAFLARRAENSDAVCKRKNQK